MSVALGAVLLSSLVGQSRPWRRWEAGSEQRPPVYLGLSPLELEQGRAPRGAALPARLRAAGEAAALRAAAGLSPGDVELEAWPIPDDYGQPQWQLSRWRPAGGTWRWLSAGAAVYRPSLESERRAIFDDFLKLPSLYDKPVFGDCVWTSADGARAEGAWLPTSRRESFEKKALGEGLICRLLGQPARVDGAPAAFVLKVARPAGGPAAVTWPADLRWRAQPAEAAPSPAPRPRDPGLSWPADFERSLRQDVLALDGEAPARYPLGRVERFTRKSAAQKDNQLGAVADFLMERYRALGLAARREPFMWRGIPQANVMGVIRGRERGEKPVLLVDHIDTAFAEDVFESSGARASAPGADDDATGTAALLRAAAVLAGKRPKRDIWLVHLTGEEFPGDDLGARKFLARVLRGQREFSAVIVLDMLGHRNAGDPVFQINPGRAPGSEQAAATMLALSSAAAPGLSPAWRAPSDERSYLYNTDGQLFSDAGYPTVLLNEHINRLENYGRPGHHRPGYHRTDDVAAGVDFGYAAKLAKLAIATAWTLAN